MMMHQSTIHLLAALIHSIILDHHLTIDLEVHGKEVLGEEAHVVEEAAEVAEDLVEWLTIL